jgi:murein DD-endopeptidase MepM/ murein hydrolase activator NlpD
MLRRLGRRLVDTVRRGRPVCRPAGFGLGTRSLFRGRWKARQGGHAGPPLQALRASLALLLVVIFASTPATASADSISDLRARIGQAQTAVRELTSRRQGQQGTVEQLRGVTGAYAADLRKVDAELMAAVGRFRQAEADLERVDAEAARLEEEIAAKEEAVQQRANVYGTRLRALYKFTRTSPLEQLLGARSFTDALHRMTMMQAVTRVDNRLLGQLRAEHDELARAREALAQKRAEQAALRDELDQQRLALEERRAEQAALVARAQQEQRSAEMALSELDREAQSQAARIRALELQFQRELEEIERQRQEEIRRLEQQREQERQAQAAATAQAIAQATAAAQARVQATQTAQAAATSRVAPTATPAGGRLAPSPTATVPAAARLAGTATPRAGLPGSVNTSTLQPSAYNMQYPVGNPVVTTEWGERTFAQNFHTGIDLAQQSRTPVLAASDGVVLEAGLAVPGKPDQSYGMMVTIGHGNNLSTLYAHLDVGAYAPTVKAGDRVKRGQIIGYIGMTGITSGPHVHFEVRENGQPQNPRKYLPR